MAPALRPELSKALSLPMIAREAPIVEGSFDKVKRTFEVVWTTGAEVMRRDWWTGERWIEALEVSDKAVRMTRLNSGRSNVLNNHSSWALDNILGVVKRAWIVKGEGRAEIQLSERDEIAGLVADIGGGIIRNISCGYITHALTEELRDGVKLRRATDWEPVEISFVAVPADPEAGLRNAPQGQIYPCVVTRLAPPIESPALARMRQLTLGTA